MCTALYVNDADRVKVSEHPSLAKATLDGQMTLLYTPEVGKS